MNDWIEREIEEWLVTQWREEDELEFETMMDNLPKIKSRYVNKTTRYLLLRS